jgi:hypothetical protein
MHRYLPPFTNMPLAGDVPSLSRDSRPNTLGATSGRLGISTPTTPSELHRTTSAELHLNSHTLYHEHSNDGCSDERAVDDSSDDSGTMNKVLDDDKFENGLEKEESLEIVPEVRNVIENQRDLEAARNLEKETTGKSGRCMRDPNLVTWDGADDPEVSY